jgi:hypothetical protein
MRSHKSRLVEGSKVVAFDTYRFEKSKDEEEE